MHNTYAKHSDMTLPAITRTDIVKFAGAGGDFNPVHHDEIYAKKLGFPSVFAMGMLTASLGSRAFTQYLSPDGVYDYQVIFKKPVWPSDKLTIRILNGNRDECSNILMPFEMVDQANETKLTGSFSNIKNLVTTEEKIEPKIKWLKGRCFTIGKNIQEIHFPIEAGKIKAFANAINLKDKIYYDTGFAINAGYTNIPTPLTFSLVSATYLDNGDAIDLPKNIGLILEKVVHGKHRWRIFQNPTYGESFNVIRVLKDVFLRPFSQGELLVAVIRSRFYDSDGQCVIEEEMSAFELP